MKELKICECFNSLQGEGKYVGKNSIFLRLSGCNLACLFCDSQYHLKGHIMSTDDIKKEIEKYNSNYLVITGGEPLIQQEGLIELLSILPKKYFVTIETNATIMPNENLFDLVNHWSCSPKLASSGNDIDKRINYDVLKFYNQCYDSIFKFVVSNRKDLKETLFLEDQLQLNKDKIYLMPEGKTIMELNMRTQSIINMCKENNFHFSPRLHILVWGTKKGV